MLKSIVHIHTYIHNSSLQPFSQEYGLASQTSHVVCVHFIRDNLTSTPSDRFLRNLTRQVYLLSGFFSEICWKEVTEENFSYFIFDDWPGVRTQAFPTNKPTHCLLDYGDYKFIDHICEIFEMNFMYDKSDYECEMDFIMTIT